MTTMYTQEHEWINIEDHEAATVGITQHAQDALGDVVFVDLPEVGRTLDQFASFGVVESVKAVSDLFAPVSGEVVATNEKLASSPELVNRDPFGDGWILRVRMSAPAEVDELLEPAAYEALTAEA